MSIHIYELLEGGYVVKGYYASLKDLNGNKEIKLPIKQRFFDSLEKARDYKNRLIEWKGSLERLVE